VALQHQRHAIDHHVEKAANQQAKNYTDKNKGRQIVGHNLERHVLADHRTQLEDRQIHRHDKATNQSPKHSHDHWFHQGGEVVYGVVHFFFVITGGLIKHFVQRAGFFADSCHLHGHSGEDAGAAHGEVQLSTRRHVHFDLVYGVAENHVAG